MNPILFIFFLFSRLKLFRFGCKKKRNRLSEKYSEFPLIFVLNMRVFNCYTLFLLFLLINKSSTMAAMHP